jgi:hypothetical protein
MTLPLEVLAILALCFRCGNAFLITQHNEPHNSLTASVHDVHKRKMIRLKSQEKSYAFMALNDATQLWENDVSAFVYLIPPVAAAGAFNGYEATAATFHRFVDVLSNNNWYVSNPFIGLLEIIYNQNNLDIYNQNNLDRTTTHELCGTF